MNNLTADAQVRLGQYLGQVKTALSGCRSVDAEDVLSDVQGHIADALEGKAGPISYNELDGVLKRLGSPGQWVPEEEMVWWRRIILRLRHGPEDWRLAYLSFGVLVLGFIWSRPGFLLLVPVSFILSRAALSTVVSDHKELGAQKWLIYPSMIMVSAFAGFWLVFWPAFALGGLAETIAQERFNVFFLWNVSNENAYWPVAIMFIIAGVGLWWFIVGSIHRKWPQLLQHIFRPFLDGLTPRRAYWMVIVGVIITTVCSIAGILLSRFISWHPIFYKTLE